MFAKQMNVYQTINILVRKMILLGMLQAEDKIYARNQAMSYLGLFDFPDHLADLEDVEIEGQEIPDLLETLERYAVGAGIIENLADEKEILSSKIMNVFMPKPSEVNKVFYQKYAESPQKATEYFYALSRNSNYIQTNRIEKNIIFKVETTYGTLDVTINLAKPEKDPQEIARAKEREVLSGYPKCPLCIENEGYAGRIGYPARSNHRMVRLTLAHETWYMQYSPYEYFNEHCIVLSEEHRDMAINRKTFQRLLEFVEAFPHYFIGSNADLPIVGGSILTHDHYQGGRYEFPLQRAPEEFSFTMRPFPSIKAATVKWPMSVIRLRGSDKESLISASTHILEKWTAYSDPGVQIIAFTDSTRHNTITPIVRMKHGEFQIDLVLRNNRTDDEHSLGIFHPHSDVHHIKKENIGLIEVMGLAVLPERLKTELIEVEKCILGVPNQIAPYHRLWAEDIKERYYKMQRKITPYTVREIIQKEVGLKFLRVLEDAGVFKRDERGEKAFKSFIATLDAKESC